MNANKLLEAALSLPAEERARLAHNLLGSLDGPADSGSAEAWIGEIEKRAEDLADGTVLPVDWVVARERIRRRLHEHRS
jgi:putative addiction module component (TIGR02574 family)